MANSINNGTTCVRSYFVDIADYNSIKQSLSRLDNDIISKLRKVLNDSEKSVMMSAATGVSKAAVKRHLQKLQSLRYIERTG